jgi:hypothetical protein
MDPKVNRLDISPQQMQDILSEIQGKIKPEVYTLIEKIFKTLIYIFGVLERKELSRSVLCRILFGPSSEKTREVLRSQEQATPPESGEKTKGEGASTPSPLAPSAVQSPTTASSPKPKPKGHGRHGVEDYPNAQRVEVPHPELKPKDPCPECRRGKLYPAPPSEVVRIRGQAPLLPIIFVLNQLRCNLCGKVFTAPAPAQMGLEKYDSSAVATMALFKYGMGIPFYRLENFQAMLEIPLPSSTQWEMVERLGQRAQAVWAELVEQAANGPLFLNDDTGAIILDEKKRLKEEEERGNPPERKGTFTTGMVGMIDQHTVVLFFTGHKHAGENLAGVLAQRKALEVPIQMCDGLNRNEPKGFQMHHGNCMAHGRRKFVVLVEVNPEEVRHLLEGVGTIYGFESEAKAQGMSPEARLAFHQEHSGPVMEGLKSWMEGLLSEKKVEPNSGLGKAIHYMLSRWEKLTLFLRQAGAPLDNNLCERVLKLVVLGRKNWLFFKTRNGARIGDIMMSLIATCKEEGVNPFDYFVALYDHAEEVKKAPGQWLPWNYREALACSAVSQVCGRPG